jgi:hypothetical protein
MKNALKNNNFKFVLLGKIKGLAGEVKHTRKRLLKSKSEKITYSLADRKRIVGYDARHHLLAYAYLRGVPYRKVEKNCALDNRPSPGLIFEIIEAHAPKWLPYDQYTKSFGGAYAVSLNDVHVWLGSI